MKNLTRISITLVTLAGLASVAVAGDGAKPAAPAPADKKAPAPAPTPAPTADKAAPVAPDKAAPAFVAPKPAPELAAAFKAMSGNWKCTGTAMTGPEMKEGPTKGTVKSKMDLDNFWIVTTYAETKKGGFKVNEYSSFDATTKKWKRLMIDNMGGHEISESSGMTDNKMVWDGAATGMGMTMKSRHTETIVGPKEMKMLGEYSMDNGKTFQKAYDVTCKK
jgi:hypothetical protein